MKNSIGLLEFKSIAKGIEVTDEVLKSSNVELISANPICPGKYISIVSGDVGAVKNAVEIGKKLGGVFQIEALVIANIHPDIFPALTGTAEMHPISCIGIIETMSSLSSIMVADTAIKASNINIIEIRIARGLGGKGFTIISGEVSSVKRAIMAVEDKYMATGEILCASTVANPEKELIKKIFG
ncbi:MAG: propanediol utilization protein [Firmicutes bacterium HGW-Firmicutes-1]|jgi:microcompartment protein CcmL/EutN|nr:MAG: propanediol utilization protein [Firmicutes bacterium HGW-Firmicutes-1]